jgi:5-methylcytosine-specific restriction protein A
MSRSVKEWIGKTDDTPVPPRVRDRVFDAKDRRCHACGRQIPPRGEAWTCEHLVAIINGGANREINLGLTCCNCLPAKNAADVAQKSLVARKRKKDRGIKARRSRPMMGTIASGWKRPVGGGPAVRR